MTVDWTKPIQTEDGREAKLVFKDESPDVRWKRLVVIKNMTTGEWFSEWFSELGASAVSKKLINVPERVTRYGVAYDDGDMILGGANPKSADTAYGKGFAVHIEGDKISAEWVE